MRGDISLADLYTAMHELAPDDEAAIAIVRLLDLKHAAVSVARTAPKGAYDPRQSPGRRRSERTRISCAKVLPFVPDEPHPPVIPAALETVAERATPTPSRPPAWVNDPAVIALPKSQSKPPPPRDPKPLFAELCERAILGTALSVSVPEGGLDVERIIENRATLRAMDTFPRLPIPTVRNGVDLLLDHAESMAPYQLDREQVAQSIRDVVGKSRVREYRFRGCPTRKVMGAPTFDPEDWKPPPRGTAVAAVTDLGLGGFPLHRDRAGRTEWLEFASQARAAGCPVVVFVPFPPHRWDPMLAGAMTLVQWDRATTARAVSKTVALRGVRE